MEETAQLKALKKAVLLLGGKRGTANALNRVKVEGFEFDQIKEHAVHHWIRNKGQCPSFDLIAIRLEFATDGDITRYQLRPDVYGFNSDQLNISN